MNVYRAVDIIQFGTIEQEAVAIAAFVEDQINNHGYRPEDVLILAQRRLIGSAVHRQLRERGLPAKSYYQESELDSVVAQERLAIFKLFINRSDRIALRWLLGSGSPDFRRGAYARVFGSTVPHLLITVGCDEQVGVRRATIVSLRSFDHTLSRDPQRASTSSREYWRGRLRHSLAERRVPRSRRAALARCKPTPGLESRKSSSPTLPRPSHVAWRFHRT